MKEGERNESERRAMSTGTTIHTERHQEEGGG